MKLVVSKEMLQQTQEMNLQPKIRQRRQGDGRINVNVVMNSIWVRHDQLTDVISLEYKPELKLPLTKRIYLKIQNWQRWCLSLMLILGNCSSPLIRLMSKLRNMDTAWAWDGLLGSTRLLHINCYDHYTQKKWCSVYKNLMLPWITRHLNENGNRPDIQFRICSQDFYCYHEERNMRNMQWSALVVILVGFVFQVSRIEWFSSYWAFSCSSLEHNLLSKCGGFTSLITFSMLLKCQGYGNGAIISGLSLFAAFNRRIDFSPTNLGFVILKQ